MMDGLCFMLSGKTGFFKKPDVNVETYFTYNNIHKPALLGLLGAILGLKGHSQLTSENQSIFQNNKLTKKKEDKLPLNEGFPEYYDFLHQLKVAITPNISRGVFPKKIQVFNNSVGYASKEKGGNLIVREQWLEQPSWTVMILDDDSIDSFIFTKLKSYLLHKETHYIPYLGKNDHPATIENVKEIAFELAKGEFVDSLFKAKSCTILGWDEKKGTGNPFLFREISPNSLNDKYHFYEYETFLLTNQNLESLPENTYSYDENNYYFF